MQSSGWLGRFSIRVRRCCAADLKIGIRIFFLDVGKYGLEQISLYVLGLGLGFLAMGFLFVALAKGLQRMQPKRP